MDVSLHEILVGIFIKHTLRLFLSNIPLLVESQDLYNII